MAELRWYQEKIIHDIRLAIASNHKRVIAQLATGGGKSVIIRSIVASAIAKQKRIGIVAHRDELIRQLEKHVIKAGISPDLIGRIQSDHPSDYGKDIQVCSIQTLCNRELPDLDLIIWDEAHHCMASTYRLVIENYPEAIHLGFTATPARGDGKGLGDLFQHMVHGPTVSQLIAEGWLAPYVMYSSADWGMAPDLNGVRAGAGGDFNQQELAERVEDADLVGDLVATWEKRVQGRDNERTVVFAVNRHHAQVITEEYKDAGVRADWIDSKMTIADRQKKILGFIRGEIVVLVTIGIVSEGFDLSTYAELFDEEDADIACVQIARPTRSLSLYLQMVGRCLRPGPIGKVAIILDHANAQAMHGLPCDPHVWSLEGVRRRNRAEAAAEEEENRERQEREQRMVPVTDRFGELVKVDPSDRVGRFVLMARENGERRAWIHFLRLKPTLDEIVDAARFSAQQRSPTWCYRQWLETGARPNIDDLEDLKAIARRFSFHWKWAIHERARLVREREMAQGVQEEKTGVPVVLKVIPGVRE